MRVCAQTLGEILERPVAALAAKALIGPGTLVLPIQNGIGSAERIVEVLGEDPATLASAVEQLGGAFPGQRIGADAVLVTCSSIGPAIPVARQLYDFPILRIDERLAAGSLTALRLFGVEVPLRGVISSAVADEFGFNPDPRPAPGEPDC